MIQIDELRIWNFSPGDTPTSKYKFMISLKSTSYGKRNIYYGKKIN